MLKRIFLLQLLLVVLVLANPIEEQSQLPNMHGILPETKSSKIKAGLSTIEQHIEVVSATNELKIELPFGNIFGGGTTSLPISTIATTTVFVPATTITAGAATLTIPASTLPASTLTLPASTTTTTVGFFTITVTKTIASTTLTPSTTTITIPTTSTVSTTLTPSTITVPTTATVDIGTTSTLTVTITTDNGFAGFFGRTVTTTVTALASSSSVSSSSSSIPPVTTTVTNIATLPQVTITNTATLPPSTLTVTNTVSLPPNTITVTNIATQTNVVYRFVTVTVPTVSTFVSTVTAISTVISTVTPPTITADPITILSTISASTRTVTITKTASGLLDGIFSPGSATIPQTIATTITETYFVTKSSGIFGSVGITPIQSTVTITAPALTITVPVTTIITGLDLSNPLGGLFGGGGNKVTVTAPGTIVTACPSDSNILGGLLGVKATTTVTAPGTTITAYPSDPSGGILGGRTSFVTVTTTKSASCTSFNPLSDLFGGSKTSSLLNLPTDIGGALSSILGPKTTTVTELHESTITVSKTVTTTAIQSALFNFPPASLPTCPSTSTDILSFIRGIIAALQNDKSTPSNPILDFINNAIQQSQSQEFNESKNQLLLLFIVSQILKNNQPVSAINLFPTMMKIVQMDESLWNQQELLSLLMNKYQAV